MKKISIAGCIVFLLACTAPLGSELRQTDSGELFGIGAQEDFKAIGERCWHKNIEVQFNERSSKHTLKVWEFKGALNRDEDVAVSRFYVEGNKVRRMTFFFVDSSREAFARMQEKLSGILDFGFRTLHEGEEMRFWGPCQYMGHAYQAELIYVPEKGRAELHVYDVEVRG